MQTTSFTGTLYHGSNEVFERFDRRKERVQNNFYGGGAAYLVDSRDIAVQYAKNMSKGGRGSPVLYTVDARFRKVFDTTAEFDGKTVAQLLPHDVGAFARDVGLISSGTNSKIVVDSLKEGNISLTGIDIFRGLSRGMQYPETARDFLERRGYDALKYMGGTIARSIGNAVYLVYDPNSLTIRNGELLAFSKR